MTPAPRYGPGMALLIRILGVAALSTTIMLVKLCGERGIHLTEIMFWRQFVTIPTVGLWLWATKSLHTLRTNRFSAHLRRSAFGVLAMTFVFGAVQLLPLAEAQTLSFTGPFWATLLAMVMLREKVGLWRWSALGLGFLGILVITQPGQSHIPLLGVAVGLTGAFLVALASILIKDLNRTERPLAIVFWFSLLASPMTAVFLPFFMTQHDLVGWALLVGMGFCGAIGQVLLTLALRYGAVSAVIVMDYTGLVWATLFGWLIWDHLPPFTTWLGMPLIVAAGLLIAWREHALARERYATTPAA